MGASRPRYAQPVAVLLPASLAPRGDGEDATPSPGPRRRRRGRRRGCVRGRAAFVVEALSVAVAFDASGALACYSDADDSCVEPNGEASESSRAVAEEDLPRFVMVCCG